MLSSIMYKQEMAAFLFWLLVLWGVSGSIGKKHHVLSSFWHLQILIFILAVYFAGVCHFTLLHRDITAGMRYELSLFWSYRYTMEYGSRTFYFELLYNILLLLPMGILLPLYQKLFGKFRYTGLAGFGVSCLIETCQLLFHLGLFEFDDMFNNTLGCCMGYSVYYMGDCIWKGIMGKKKEKRWYLKLGMLLLLDVFVVWYFWRFWRDIQS